MTVSYTKVVARKILLVFLVITIIFSLVTLFVRNSIIEKLESVSKLAHTADNNQSRPERALLLLHQAEEDFQESLLNVNSQKSTTYKLKLSRAFNEIDTLLKESTDTSHLTPIQSDKVNFWHHKKLKLSDKMFSLKHNFDSLLSVYSNFNETDKILPNPGTSINSKQNNYQHNTIDTVRKVLPVEKKGLFKRLKDAISNKNNKSSTVEQINNTKDNTIDLTTQKIAAANRNAYTQKLKQLQLRNESLLSTQRELIVLNTHIINELERIINEAKEINYKMADDFKVIALKTYQETTNSLNKFYLADIFLVIAFAVSLIIFIIQLNRSELYLRKESERAIISAQQKIDELIKNIVPDDALRSPKIDELEEIVHLAINNNPAFLMKFNEFDPEFIKELLSLSPSLIATEIEFCVLLRLNFETKEIARYTKTSVRSVEGKKYRIRKKLCIPSDQDINIWMTNI